MPEITIHISDKALKIPAILFGTAILVWVLIHLWSIGLFAPKYTLQTYVSEAEGLAVHAPVRVDGINVGTVDAIKLAANPASPDRKIELILKIEKRYEDQILSDSVAFLVTEGLLGNRYVNIQRGFRGGPIPPGGEIHAVPTKRLALKDLTQTLAKWVDCMNREEHESDGKLRSH